MKAAIIGLGWQGTRLYRALLELGVDIACVVDLDPPAVRERVPDVPAELIFTEVTHALEQHRPEVAVIATHAGARLEIVRRCVEAGVPKVFCEKPLATNLDDAAEIISLTEKAGCLLSVNHLMRWSPNHIRLQRLLREGAIGKIAHIYYHSGSVGLGNVGTHMIDNMRFYTQSEVDWVMGLLDQTGTPNVRGPQYRDPAGWGMVMFKDGTRAIMDTCENTGVPRMLEIVGTYGRAVIEETNNSWSVWARAPKDRELPLTLCGTPLLEEVLPDTVPWDVQHYSREALKELIFDGTTRCTGLDGYRALEVVIAFHVSHRHQGARITLPLDNELHTLDVNWA